MIAACDDCLRRTDLIAALAGWLDIEWRRRDAPSRVLALADDALLDAADDAAVRRRYAAFDAAAARAAVARAGLSAVCRCDDRYPAPLRELHDPPAVLHVAAAPHPPVTRGAVVPGGRAAVVPRALERLGGEASVAVVGARRATDYGVTVARELGRGLSAAGVAVVSGLALGVDSAAHVGALQAGAASVAVERAVAPLGGGAASVTVDGAVAPLGGGAAPVAVEGAVAPLEAAAAPVAVLAGGADRPYPASKRQLYARVRAAGAVVSEMPPGFGIHRWAFVARNRLIAALARVVVVVEATERSGSLTTADLGAELGRTIAAVPGRVTCRPAVGTNGLIRDGALLVRGPRDVLDALAELTGARYDVPPPAAPVLEPHLRRLLDAIGAGHSTLPMLAGEGFPAREVLAGLGELEARGLVRRGFGGRYEPVP